MMRKCSKCLVTKDVQTFVISNYGSKGQTLFKNSCKQCDAANRRIVRKLKRIHTKPVEGTRCQIKNCLNTNLCLDHDHLRSEFRGWICAQHNAAIGAMNDSYEGVLDVLEYLKPTKMSSNTNKNKSDAVNLFWGCNDETHQSIKSHETAVQ